MNDHLVTCTLCGLRFDPLTHPACPTCPLAKSCQLVCCPACGYELLDLDNSRLAHLAKRFLSHSPVTEKSVKDHELR